MTRTGWGCAPTTTSLCFSSSRSFCRCTLQLRRRPRWRRRRRAPPPRALRRGEPAWRPGGCRAEGDKICLVVCDHREGLKGRGRASMIGGWAGGGSYLLYNEDCTPTQQSSEAGTFEPSLPFFLFKNTHSCASCVVVCLTVESVRSQGTLDAGGHEHKVKSSGERHLLHRLTEQPQCGRGAEAWCEEIHGRGVLGLREEEVRSGVLDAHEAIQRSFFIGLSIHVLFFEYKLVRSPT